MRQGSILAYLKAQEPQASNKDAIAAVQVSVVQSGTDLGKQLRDFADVEDNGGEIVRVTQTSQPSSISLRDRRISIDKVYRPQIGQLKTITSTLLPVRYSDNFFKECLDAEAHSVLCGVASYDSKPVGWIRCRVEPFPNVENHVADQIYIQVLGVLAPYRSLGMASELLQYIIEAAKERGLKLTSIYAHVWEHNDSALEWYAKRGFKRILLQQQYYRRLTPSGAWIIRKELT